MSIELRIPAVGESIQEVQIGQWLKREGDRVAQDEAIVELETDKASMELPAPSSGVLSKILKHDGETVAIGEVIAELEPGEGGADGKVTEAKAAPSAKPKAEAEQTPVRRQAAGASSRQAQSPKEAAPRAADAIGPESKAAPPRPAPSKEDAEAGAEAGEEEPAAAPSVRRMLREHHLRAEDIKPNREGGRLQREDVARYIEEHAAPPRRDEQSPEGEQRHARSAVEPEPALGESSALARRTEAEMPDEADNIVPMSLIRRRIAERLVEARQKAALLTTFNEIDLSAVIELRGAYRDSFHEKHGVKLGFMSFFVKAAVEGLRQFPAVNAEVRGTDIVYHNSYHIGVAIGSGRGLVVPVVQHADRLSFAEIERAIGDFGQRAETNKLTPNELVGGTFTISNGGIYGSLLSTPIVNPPQSGVLGMHAIQERPVARDGNVVIRPMMYVALTYDHRIIDGREAVSFLKLIKDLIEAPARLLIGV